MQNGILRLFHERRGIFLCFAKKFHRQDLVNLEYMVYNDRNGLFRWLEKPIGVKEEYDEND